MKPIDKLREILKTFSDNKKDLEELKMGAKVLYSYWGSINPGLDNEYQTDIEEEFIYISKYEIYDTNNKETIDVRFLGENYSRIKLIEIIGNPLEERHLKLYALKNNFILRFNNFGDIHSESLEICRLDNTKSFNDQTDEVYESIVKFLESNKNIMSGKDLCVICDKDTGQELVTVRGSNLKYHTECADDKIQKEYPNLFKILTNK